MKMIFHIVASSAAMNTNDEIFFLLLFGQSRSVALLIMMLKSLQRWKIFNIIVSKINN